MLIKMINFGDILLSRPAGREAFLFAKAYVFKEVKKEDELILDFYKIKVLTPAWADEFISGVKKEYSGKIQFLNTDNPSVKASLKTVFESLNND